MEKEKLDLYYRKILSLLGIRTVAGGLEISDTVLRLLYANGKTMEMSAVVLGPGVVEKGYIKDAVAFAAALKMVREKIRALRGGKKINVVVSLSSVSIYTQSFTLPLMEGNELKKAIDLNVQMSSPDDLAKYYFSTEVLDRDADVGRLEVSAAFIEKQLVDDLTRMLFSAGFVTLSVESHALSLVRAVREKALGIDGEGSYLILDVDNTGIDFFVMKKGRLYFEYATPWTDIADAKGEMTMEKFTAVLSADLRQVINFYRQHWQDALTSVIVSSTMFYDDVERITKEVSALPVVGLTINANTALSPEWLAAFGASLRGVKASINDNEINLGGEGAKDAFREEQAIHFLDVWQILVPISLGILVAALAATNHFLADTEAQLVKNVTFSQQSQQVAQVSALQASSTAFNAQVQLVLAAESHKDKGHLILDAFNNLAQKNSIKISRLTLSDGTAPISLSGIATTENDIIQFKNDLQNDHNFGTVSLPLSEIQPSLNAFSFSMTVQLAANAFQ